MTKRVLSVLLALMMCLTMLPVEALAEIIVPVTEKNAPAEPEATAKTVGEVQALIDALPAVEALTAEDYEAVLTAYEAYEALPEEERAQVTGAERFEKLLGWFNSQTATQEGLTGNTTQQSTSVVKITPKGSAVSYYYDTVDAALSDHYNNLYLSGEVCEITLLKDAALEGTAGQSTISLQGEYTLDLAGFTLTTAKAIHLEVNTTDITIKGGTVTTTATDSYYLIHQNARNELHLENVTLVGPVKDGKRSAALSCQYYTYIKASNLIGGLVANVNYCTIYAGSTITTGADTANGIAANDYSVFEENNQLYNNISALLSGGKAFAVDGKVINAAAAAKKMKVPVISDTALTEGFALTEDVTMVTHEKHEYDTTGACPCGAACSHGTVNMENGKCADCQKRIYEAKIGDNGYGMLTEAFAAASTMTDATVVLLGYLTYNNAEIAVNNGTFTLDLNDNYISLLPVGKKLYINEEANVTVVGDGKLPTSNGGTLGAMVEVSGTLTVKSGSFTRGLTIKKGGNALLSGGYFYTLSVPDGKVCSDYLAEGYAFHQNNKVVSGEVTSLSNVLVKPHTSHTYDETGTCACGATCPHEGDWDTETGICKDCGKLIYTAKIGTKGYATLQGAITAAAGMTDAVITLLADTDSSEEITVTGGSFTIELNGKTVKVQTEDNSKNFYIRGGAAVTFTGSGTMNCVVEVYEGTAYVKGGEFTALSVRPDGNAVLSGGYFVMLAAEENCYDLLAEGYAYQNRISGEIVSGQVLTLSGVEVVPHTDHVYDAATGTCVCGKPCPHETFYTDGDGHTEGTCTLCGKQAVIAKMGTEYYRDVAALNAAMNGVTGNPTVTILCDIEGNLKIMKSELTLDAGSYTINGTVVVNGSTVTITGGSFDKKVTLGKSVVTLMGGFEEVNIVGGETRIERGTSIRGNAALRGKVTIDFTVFESTVSVSGTVTAANTNFLDAVTINNGGDLTIKDGCDISAAVNIKSGGKAHFTGRGSVTGLVTVQTGGELTVTETACTFNEVFFDTNSKGVLSGGAYGQISSQGAVLNTKLAEGYAYFDERGVISGDYQNGTPGVVKIASNVRVAAHSHSFNAEGICGCGTTCPHENYYTDSMGGHTEGACTLCGKQAMYAKVVRDDGDTVSYYATLNEAAAAAGELGGSDITAITVEMLADCKEDVTVSKGCFTISGGSHKYTLNGDLTESGTAKMGVLNMTVNGKLTMLSGVLANNVINGEATLRGTTVRSGIFNEPVAVTGEITIEGGLFQKTVEVTGSAITIWDGDFTELILSGAGCSVSRISGGQFAKITSNNLFNLSEVLVADKAYANRNTLQVTDGWKTLLTNVMVVDHTDHTFALNADGHYVCDCGAVALVRVEGDTEIHYYSDLDTIIAIAERLTKGTIIVLEDKALTPDYLGGLELTSGTFTLDLNKKTFKEIYIKGTANITMKNCNAYSGVLTVDGANASLTLESADGAEVTVFEGSFTVPVGCNPQFKQLEAHSSNVSLGGGYYKTIRSWGSPLTEIVAEGYGYKQGNSWITDISWVELNEVTVTRYPISKAETALSFDGTLVYGTAYGDEYYAYANVTVPTGTAPETGYEWYIKQVSTVDQGKMTGDDSARVTIPQGLEVGEYEIWYTITVDDYSVTALAATFEMIKGTDSVKTAPTATNPVYTGGVLELVTEGVGSQGEMRYKLDGGEWQANIPTATEAGEYKVYYKSIGNENFEESEEGCVTATIARRDISGAEIALGASLIYNTKEQTQAIESVVLEDFGVVKSYIVSGNTATDAGTDYELTVTGTGNFTGSVKVKFAVEPAWIIIGSVTVAPKSYDGSDEATVTGVTFTGIYAGDTVEYEVVSAKYDSAEAATATKVIGYVRLKDTVKNYKLIGDRFEVDAAIGKAAAEVVTAPTAEELIYSTAAQTLTTAGTAAGGSMRYKLGDGEWQETIPTATNAGTYTVWYKAAGDDNHNDTEPESVTVIIARKQVTNPVVTVATCTYNGKDQTPALTVRDPQTFAVIPAEEYTVTYRNNRNVGLGNIILSDNEGGNYIVRGLTSFAIGQAAAPTVEPLRLTQKYSDTNTHTVSRDYAALMPQDAYVSKNFEGGSYTAPAGVTLEGWGVAVASGEVTYQVRGATAEMVGEEITLPVIIKSRNYKDTTAEIIITLVAKDTPAVTAADLTMTYTGSAVPIELLKASAVFDGSPVAGSWSWKNGSPIHVIDSGSYMAVFTPEDQTNFTTAECEVKVTVEPRDISDAAVMLGSWLRYNGSEQTQTVFSVTLTGYDDVTYTVKDNIITNAGEDYELTVTGTGDFTGSIKQRFTVGRAALTIAGVTIAPKSYDGSRSATVTGVTFDGLYNSDTVAYTVVSARYDSADADKASKVTGEIALAESVINYKLEDGSFSADASIDEAASGVTTTPVRREGLIYTGKAQELVTAGSATGGSMQYKLGDGAWQQTVPTATDAGTYTVWYRVVGDNNHYDTAEQSISVTIGQKDISGAKVTLGDSLTYNGSEQTQTVASVTLAGYENVTYTVSGNTATDAGEDYELTVNGTGNFTGSVKVGFSVAAAQLSGVSAAQNGKLTYNGKAQQADISATGTGKDGRQARFSYATEENGTYGTMPGFTEAGSYTVYYKAELENHETVTDHFTVTIDPLDIGNAVITLGENPVYDGGIKTVKIESVKVDDLTLTAADYTIISGSTGTNADDYTLKITGTGNFTGSREIGWRIEKADQTMTAPAVNGVYGGKDRIAPKGAVGAVTYRVTGGSDVISIDETGTISFLRGGDATVLVMAAGDENHHPTELPVAVHVEKAVLTVTAADKDAYVGSAVPDLENPEAGKDYFITGFVGEDTAEMLDISVALSYPTAPDMRHTGSHEIRLNITGSDSRYELVAVNGTLTISAIPVPCYRIQVFSGAYGSISPSRDTLVWQGSDIAFTISPAQGYSIADVKVDGRSVGAVKQYTFRNVTADHTIEAVFTKGAMNPGTGAAETESIGLGVSALAVFAGGTAVK